jgi:predicted RNA binding protein YcfA (HicA-like mRNA interferase family)
MKLPRDLYGTELVQLLSRVGYVVLRQTGSHIIIRTAENGENTQSVPAHKPLKVGTLNGILNDVAAHLGLDKQDLMERLFSKK